jgi:exosortase A
MHSLVDRQAATSNWRATLIAAGLVFVCLLGLFWSTASGMVHTWYHTETYTHGFLILPISLWLIWQKRRHLAGFEPQPAPLFLVLVAGGLIAWVLARLAGVLVVEQAAFVAVVVATWASLLGFQVSKFLAFPLLFLFFAVPMGEDLVPPMMDFTATFTVTALELTGIPVYREGLFFSLPSGNWSVVEACSGVRYLIASITLGVMYAYITYHTLWKRLLFIAMSAVVPILANGIRAYIIVMIGHLSSMEYATGVDHLVYGWVFFGIVMFILFWVGSFWQEAESKPQAVTPLRELSQGAVTTRVAAIVVVTLVLAATTTAMTRQALSIGPVVSGKLTLPEMVEDWRLTDRPAAWEPMYLPTDQTLNLLGVGDGGEVRLHVAFFPRQSQGYEAISPNNEVAGARARLIGMGRAEVSVDSETFDVVRRKMVVAAGRTTSEYLVWQWYRVAGHSLSNRYEGKAREALARIYPGRADGAWIALVAPLAPGDIANTEARLADFAQDVLPTLYTAMDDLVGR